VRHAPPCVTPYIKINRIFIASPGAPTRGAPTFNPELIELNDFFLSIYSVLNCRFRLLAVLKGHLPFWGALAPQKNAYL
jgi:hypothetical protein